MASEIFCFLLYFLCWTTLLFASPFLSLPVFIIYRLTAYHEDEGTNSSFPAVYNVFSFYYEPTIIVTRGTGYETLQVSKVITKVLQFMLKVLRKCTIFCFTITHYGWITWQWHFYWFVAHTKFKTYCCLCTVKAKNGNKNIKQRTLVSFITRFFY